ncbi:hypothetical protein GA0115254_1185138 [Streptomyces sp. Ncost-T10-10d]|nr:hypothetical protein GA0115254_1185138 [Streptomyces sp. Ncost-T10-10d]
MNRLTMVGRRDVGAPTPAGPGRGRRSRRDRLGRLGQLHRRARISMRPVPGVSAAEHQGETPRRAASPAWWGRCRRRGPSPLARQVHHQAPPERRRPLSPALSRRHTMAASGLHPVQAGELEKIRVPRIGPVRPRRKPDRLAADKAYSNGPCRECLRRQGIRHSIPEKTDSQAARLRRGSRGGRPPGFDEERYKKRHTVEWAINRRKQHRAVATVTTSVAMSSSAP